MDQDIQREIKELVNRVVSLEITITRVVTTIETHTKNEQALLLQIQALIERHDHVLFGNKSSGMVIKVDRLEEKEKTRQWSIRALWSAFLVVFLKVIYDLFSSR